MVEYNEFISNCVDLLLKNFNVSSFKVYDYNAKYSYILHFEFYEKYEQIRNCIKIPFKERVSESEYFVEINLHKMYNNFNKQLEEIKNEKIVRLKGDKESLQNDLRIIEEKLKYLNK